MAHKEDYNLDLFFELSPDLLCIAGYDGYFKKVNPSFIKILGYSKKKLFETPISEFIYPEDRNITSLNREKILEGVDLLNFENRYVTKNNDIIWLAWTSFPSRNDKVVYAIAKNITYKKKLESDRNTLLNKITNINSDLKQLNYKTSHDLRSPVGNLISMFSLLDISKIEDEETLKFIDLLKKSADNLRESLNNHIDVLKEIEGHSIEIEEINIEECFIEVVNSIKILIKDSKATFELDLSGFKIIKYNRAYLVSIFLNLITNSIKYARPGSPPVISIETKISDGNRQLLFSDNGMGFDMDEVKDKIFGFNQTFHNNSDSKGIGLYLVYNHVTSLGGSISVKSSINKGAAFTINFSK